MRIGIGYDVHRLKEGRKLILGGVEVPHIMGLDGHSDADVLIHAIMDALLGALALGDIGKHFPDSDERYRGISSVLLLEHCCKLLQKYGYRIVNIDSTVIAQAPKLSPFIEEMRATVAQAMKIDLNQVSIKATTEENLGFTGAGLGISAQAVALIEKNM